MFAETGYLNAVSNQGIFDVYIGLTASGYHLANPSRAGLIYDTLATEPWAQQTLQYFGFAHIQDNRINPYWPRASILTSVSLLTGQLPVDTHLEQIRAHLKAMNNLSPGDVDDTITHWAANLPKQTGIVQTARVYTKAWQQYQQVIQDEVSENGTCYQQKMTTAQSRLGTLLLPQLSSLSPRLINILNPLQADPLTDVVNVCGHVYVVTSHLRPESCIHELIHILLDPKLRLWEERISASMALLDLVYDRMAYLTYAWDHSATSWTNVFSETLVRVITALVSDNESPGQLAQIDDLVQQGFAYALPISETIASIGKEHPLSDEWLEQCLWACARFAKHVKEN